MDFVIFNDEISDIAGKKKLKNSNIKTSERLKNIKESDDSLLRNY